MFLLVFVPFRKIQRKNKIRERNFSIISFSRMTDTLSTSINTTQEDVSLIPPTTSLRQNKYIRSQTTNAAIHEPKQVASKSSITRKIRSKYA